jgi:hypothetical protein
VKVDPKSLQRKTKTLEELSRAFQCWLFASVKWFAARTAAQFLTNSAPHHRSWNEMTAKKLPLHASILVADYLRLAAPCSRSADQKAHVSGFAGEQLVCEQAKIGATA